MLTNSKRQSSRPLIAVALAALLTSGVGGLAQAAQFTVQNLKDSGRGSLRQAILDANARVGADVIVFAKLKGIIYLTSPELIITDHVTIEGPGADKMTISVVTDPRKNPNASGVFLISRGVTAEISGLTIANGRAIYGGGISNSGTLTLNACVVSGNLATGAFNDYYGYAGYGGGIDNGGTLTVNGCTLSGNRSASYSNSRTGHFCPSLGGGIYNSGTLTLNGSTLSGNSAQEGGGIGNRGTLTLVNSTVSANDAGWYGGGICNSGTLTVVSTTVTGNWRGGISNSILLGHFPGQYEYFYGVLHMRNTIVAGNLDSNASDLRGSLASSGYNLIGIGDAASGFDSTDWVGTAEDPIAPLLGPLQNNGGPTWTHALLPGSPAIDAGDPDFDPDEFDPPLVFDQRGPGFPRIVNAWIDIGALEFSPGP